MQQPIVVEFEVETDPTGGYCAYARVETHSLVTQGDTLDELKAMIEDLLANFAVNSGQTILTYSLVFQPAPIAA
jgi:hypothetical protein